MNRVIATPSAVKELLAKYDLHALKRFGQNFLINPDIAEKIAAAACDPDCPCIEIGPGLGSLTQFLCEKAPAVYTYEIDKKLVPLLQEELKEYTNLEAVNIDFMELDLEQVPYKEKEVTFCSNLPYYITTAIISKLLESGLKIRRMVLMMQKEVAERIDAGTGDKEYGAVTVLLKKYYSMRKLANLTPSSFLPRPQIDSTVVVLTPKGIVNDPGFNSFVYRCFEQRRKTLANNLKGFCEPAVLAETLERLSLKEGIRPQELTVAQYEALYEALK